MLYKSAYQHLHISTLQYLQHHYMVQDLSVSVSPCKPSSTIVNHESLSTILPRPIAMHCSYYLTLFCPLLRCGNNFYIKEMLSVEPFHFPTSHFVIP